MDCLQNLPRIIVAGEFSPSSSNSKEVSYLSWQNTTPNLKTTCHIKLKFFLWTKLLEYLLLAKYLISVAAPLGVARQNTFAGKVMWPFQTVIYRFYLSKYTINVPFWLISCFCKKFSSTNTRDLRARKWFKL